MQRPSTKVQLQRFLGCINFYHRFVPSLAGTLAPLHSLVSSATSPSAALVWSAPQSAAFTAAKRQLSSASLLVHPDPSQAHALMADASGTAVGAVLSQGPGQAPIGFFSKKLSPAETRYSAFDRELLAAYLAVRHFRHYLEGRPFVLFTDHKPLCGALVGTADKTPRQSRHLSFLGEFSLDIRHVSGRDNVVADALSRPPAAPVLPPRDAPPAALLPPEDTAVDDAALVSASPVVSVNKPPPEDVLDTVCAIDALPLAPGLDPKALSHAQMRDAAELDSYRSGSSLSLRAVPAGQPPVLVWCDLSLGPGQPRPIVPASMVPAVFNAIHGLSHAGGRATLREISSRFVWRGMRADVLDRARRCPDCQASKVARHVKTPFCHRSTAQRRFGALHVDLVGPLPSSEGFTYLFTIIDRWTRWVEAVPLASITASDCASALLRSWIAHFGVPDEITSNQGRQFTSALWRELAVSLGIQANTTTAYHPQANGMVERIHRVLKERLMARGAGSAWMSHLPLVLLGIRTSARADSDLCPAEMTLGTTLRLPGELFAPLDPVLPSSSSSTAFADQLRSTFTAQRPTDPVHHRAASESRPGIPAALKGVSHVFLRVDAVKPPLVRPYTGPFRVLESGTKVFKVLRAGSPWVVSADRLKPALGFGTSNETSPASAPTTAPAPAPAPPSTRPSSSYASAAATGVTRFGRVVRVPSRL